MRAGGGKGQQRCGTRSTALPQSTRTSRSTLRQARRLVREPMGRVRVVAVAMPRTPGAGDLKHALEEAFAPADG